MSGTPRVPNRQTAPRAPDSRLRTDRNEGARGPYERGYEHRSAASHPYPADAFAPDKVGLYGRPPCARAAFREGTDRACVRDARWTCKRSARRTRARDAR